MLKAIVRIGGADAAESQGPAQSLRSVEAKGVVVIWGSYVLCEEVI